MKTRVPILLFIAMLGNSACQDPNQVISWTEPTTRMTRMAVWPNRRSINVIFGVNPRHDVYRVVINPGPGNFDVDGVDQIVVDTTQFPTNDYSPGNCRAYQGSSDLFCHVEVPISGGMAPARVYSVLVVDNQDTNYRLEPAEVDLPPLTDDGDVGMPIALAQSQEILSPVTQTNLHFGGQIAGGDLNDDQGADVVIAAYGEGIGPFDDCTQTSSGTEDVGGQAFVYFSPPAYDPYQSAELSATPNAQVAGASGFFASGLAVTDLNNDGVDDLFLHEPSGVAPDGRIRMSEGHVDFATIDLENPTYIALATNSGTAFGGHMAPLRDGNGDRLFVGTFNEGPNASEGEFQVVVRDPPASAAASVHTTAGADQDALLGVSFAAGRFDGDANTDLAVGGPGISEGGATGRVLLFEEGPANTFTAPATDRITTANAGTIFGHSVAAAAYDDPVNGFEDRDKLVIGEARYNDGDGTFLDDGRVLIADMAPAFGGAVPEPEINVVGSTFTQQDESYFGYALAMGDYNADYIPDLVVGAPRFFDNGAGARVGAALFFDGIRDANGFSVPTDAPVPVIGLATTPALPFHEQLGTVIANVGDINRDLSDDFAIGAPCGGQNAEEGRAVIVYGVPNRGPELYPEVGIPLVESETPSNPLAGLNHRVRFSGAGYECEIDWGDGSTPTIEQTTKCDVSFFDSLQHVFPHAGVYTVRVRVRNTEYPQVIASTVVVTVCVDEQFHDKCNLPP